MQVLQNLNYWMLVHFFHHQNYCSSCRSSTGSERLPALANGSKYQSPMCLPDILSFTSKPLSLLKTGTLPSSTGLKSY